MLPLSTSSELWVNQKYVKSTANSDEMEGWLEKDEYNYSDTGIPELSPLPSFWVTLE